MSNFQNDSIFWIEVEKIKPNPFQPRKEFDSEKLKYLSESIRQYGILQPLVVTRHEIQKEDGGLKTEYELIAGERRLRAAKLAGLQQIPAIIRTEDDDAGVKLELAIIENLQREDLNPVDRAVAFQQLAEEFGLKHIEIAKKIGRSREYVSNTIRILLLPEEMRGAISSGRITEGHSRPILMLKDKPEEQSTLFKEILLKKLTVRDAESIARKVAVNRVRKKDYDFDPEMAEWENLLAESLGTRVQIEKKNVGGKLTIDFFSNADLKKILDLVHSNQKKSSGDMLNDYIKSTGIIERFDQDAKEESQKMSEKPSILDEILQGPLNNGENNDVKTEPASEDFNSPVDYTSDKTEDLVEEITKDVIEQVSAKPNFFGKINQSQLKEERNNQNSNLSEEELINRLKQEQEVEQNNFFGEKLNQPQPQPQPQMQTQTELENISGIKLSAEELSSELQQKEEQEQEEELKQNLERSELAQNDFIEKSSGEEDVFSENFSGMNSNLDSENSFIKQNNLENPSFIDDKKELEEDEEIKLRQERETEPGNFLGEKLNQPQLDVENSQNLNLSEEDLIRRLEQEQEQAGNESILNNREEIPQKLDNSRNPQNLYEGSLEGEENLENNNEKLDEDDLYSLKDFSI